MMFASISTKPNKIKYSDGSSYVLLGDSCRRHVDMTEINAFCMQNFGDDAHIAKQKLLSGESVLVLGKGYLTLHKVESEMLLF
ncbi:MULTISPECIES: hypothetical protein [Cysteiniphilum]|nr:MULTISPECIES: hypothetical protein [Cysteiniphilum]